MAAGSRSVVLAYTLLGVLRRALRVAGELEDAAYDEAEFGLMYAARGVRESLERHCEALERILRSKGFAAEP